MRVNDKNRAKFRRIVQEGDTISYNGRGGHSRNTYQGTVTHPGNREADGYLVVMPGGISGKPVVVDYYAVVDLQVTRK